MRYPPGLSTGVLGVIMMIIAFSSKSINYLAFGCGLAGFVGCGVFYYLGVIKRNRQSNRKV